INEPFPSCPTSILSPPSYARSRSVSPCFGGIFDVDSKEERLREVEGELQQPDIWNNPSRAQELGRERARLEEEVGGFTRLERTLADAGELLELARSEADESVLASVANDVAQVEQAITDIEFNKMFSGEMDAHNAFLDIQA